MHYTAEIGGRRNEKTIKRLEDSQEIDGLAWHSLHQTPFPQIELLAELCAPIDGVDIIRADDDGYETQYTGVKAAAVVKSGHC